jgi:hypothetical protein
MKTQRKTRYYDSTLLLRVTSRLAMAIPFILMAGCDDSSPSDTETEEYYKDKQYELDWDLPAGGSSLRFNGFVLECTIGQLRGMCEISGTIPGNDVDIQIYTRDTLISVIQTVPSNPQSVLSRSFDAHLTGTLITPDNTTCDLTLNLHIEFDVNIEKFTGTLKYPASGITDATITCMGISVPWPVPFSSLLTGDVAISQEGAPPCIISAP